MTSSRIPAFYQLSVEERQRRIVEALGLTDEEVSTLVAADALPLDTADIMVENAVATFALPFGVGLNFLHQRSGLHHPDGGRGAVGDRGGLECGAGGAGRRRLRRRGRCRAP